MNSFSALSDPNEPVDPKDIEFFKFTGLVADAKVAVQKEPFDIQKYPACVSLITCASKQGYYAVATTEGFSFGTTKSLRKTFYAADKGQTVNLEEDKISVKLDKAIRQIRFSADESQLFIAAEGGVLLIFRVDDIKSNKNDAQPIHTYNLNEEIIDLRPNPEALPNLAAVLFDNNHCKIIDVTTGNTESEMPLDNVSAICWSPKGKQIVCGKLDGGLQHFDTKGACKDNLQIPESMSAGHGDEEENRRVQDVLWIENHIFLVLYSRNRHSDEDEYLNDGFIINRKPSNGSNEPLYTRLAEITPIFTTEGRGNHFYMDLIRDLGKEIKHLVIIANAATNELSVVGQTEDGEWDTWMLPENGAAELPLSEETSMDTYPLGLALDLSPDEKLPPFDASENDAGVEPMPIFYYINDEGHIGSYHCYNIELARRGESYAAYSSAAQATAAPATTSNTAASPTTTTSPPSGFSAFGASSSSGSFADLLSGKTTAPAPTSGFGGFGASTGSIPSFSNLGSAQKIPAVPSSGFAALNKTPSDAVVPQFGSTTSFGLGANKPATASTSIDKPLSAFGSATTSDQTVPKSGDATSFAAAKSPTSAFGSTSTLGGGFGSLAKNTVPGATAPNAAPAFGSTSAVGGGFGSLAKNTVPGATAPNAAPAFGSTSTVGGGFGSLAKNTVSGATNPDAAPAFGSTTTVGGGGFGSLAKNTVPGATAPKAAPTFGSTSAAANFAETSARTAIPPTTSAFGSTSTVGGGFGSLAKNTVPGATKPNPAPAFGSTSAVGGGFGSLAKNTVPGATTPNASPLFGSTSSLKDKSGSPAKSAASTPTFGSTTAFGSSVKPSTPTTPAAETAKKSDSATISLSGLGSALETKPSSTSASPSISLSGSSSPSPSISLVAKPDTAGSSSASTSKAPATKEPETPKEKIKPSAADGMAREYECIYIAVTDAIDELSSIHKKIAFAMSANELATGTKTEADLIDKDCLWNLNDVADYANLTQKIINNVAKDEENSIQALKTLESLAVNSKKSMDKKEDIKNLLNKEIDTRVVDLMDNLELDAETKNGLKSIESKSEAYGSTLENLELKVQEYKKRNKIRNDHNSGKLTLYSLHRAIRDIQRDIFARNNDLAELEDQLANMRLNESRRRARQSSAGFSCVDISDDEEEEEELGVSESAIQHTTRYIRRFNFLNQMCEQASARSPLECSTEVS